LSKPGIEIPDRKSAAVKEGEIASVYEQVPIRNLNLAMVAVRVAHQHQVDRAGSVLRLGFGIQIPPLFS
jgi:7-cyano-7-deazaguanine synthase in queuosine biosynthesis